MVGAAGLLLTETLQIYHVQRDTFCIVCVAIIAVGVLGHVLNKARAIVMIHRQLSSEFLCS